MSNLANLGKPPPSPLPEIWMQDGFGLTYKFVRYNLDARPDLHASVYAYVSIRQGVIMTFPVLEYVGRAVDLRDRLDQHERLAEARRRGATELWVHTPGWSDPIGYFEAERRLIETYQPPMCEQHPAPLGRLGDLLGTLQSRPASPSLASLGANLGSLANLGR